MRLLGKIERQINQLLALDEDALKSLAELSDQVLLLELINTDFIIYIMPSEEGLHLQTAYGGNSFRRKPHRESIGLDAPVWQHRADNCPNNGGRHLEVPPGNAIQPKKRHRLVV